MGSWAVVEKGGRRYVGGKGEERRERTLLATLINTKPLKVQIPARAKLRLDRARDVQGALHAQRRHPAGDDAEVDGDDAGHLDGAAEGDLAVALREVQVAD